MYFQFYILVSLVSSLSLVLAGTPIPNISPFLVNGVLDGPGSVNASDYNSGGTNSVNGFTVTIPKNLIVQFPAAWVSFPKLAAAGLSGYEVSVAGKVVNGKVIAGQIQLSQLFLKFGQGYISAVDTAAGTLSILGGLIVRINNPNSVCSKGTTGNELFTADDENPSITAFSRFPICIPRSGDDPKYPSSNRPAGQLSFEAPNPLVIAPFIVGDFLKFGGIKLPNSKMLVYSIIAPNVQITTKASATVPNYIRAEDALIAVFDNKPAAEFADTRFIGYLSDFTSSGVSVTINAIDVDPCTGDITERVIGNAIPKAGDLRGKWIFRADSTTLSRYTREHRNGIVASQFVQPITAWVFPEPNVPGVEQPPFDFNGINDDGNYYGQLSPFPGPAPPAAIPSTCTTNPTPVATPIAKVNTVADVRKGALVTLVGSNTEASLTNADLNFAWTQIAGSPTVTLTGSDKPSASFTTPAVTTITTFTFSLKISLKSSPSVSSTDTVTFRVDPKKLDVVVIDTYTWASTQRGTIAVTLHSNVVDGSNTAMTLILGGTTQLVIARSTKKPTSVQARSNIGGLSAVVTTTTSKKRSVVERRAEILVGISDAHQ
ncbi:uncharacterized protein BDZ99DRAFT_538460 [Mytilinidion resinicola]|uniref:Uncharacterized protein n=1 Tax=Mytilinidion resinicola TaxID=574789 RepID=A0A6A6YBT3_9PEZI|nr:uncharacterized protein BDZ99DRAFT_538460 [Mytilinidion resinicola]KAF2806272.1 hypothetical protein BDZ99DRAFT_538460 [Mytilinidion resinicola]